MGKPWPGHKSTACPLAIKWLPSKRSLETLPAIFERGSVILGFFIWIFLSMKYQEREPQSIIYEHIKTHGFRRICTIGMYIAPHSTKTNFNYFIGTL